MQAVFNRRRIMRWLRICNAHATRLRTAIDGQQRSLIIGLDALLGTHVARRNREHYGTFLERLRIFRRWRRWMVSLPTAATATRKSLARTMLDGSARLTVRRRVVLVCTHRGYSDGHRHAEHGLEGRGVGPHGCLLRWAAAAAGIVVERARVAVCKAHLQLMRTARHFAAWRGVALGDWCINSRAYINVRQQLSSASSRP
jgi:hypothetical protein